MAFPRPPGRTGRIDESAKDFLPAVEVDVPMQPAEFARDSDAPAFGVLSPAEQDALCVEREARLAKNFP